jgi:2-C-methyl-D-erythritol 2,4-cyclodiphosphate synthase
MMRVGIGYDSHRFDPSRTMVLGGVTIPEGPGLAGHSDGDAIAHAVIDALLGAVSLGDVGSHFPPGDEAWKDADSMELLTRSVTLLRDAGYRPLNVDVVVVCERPKIRPWALEIQDRLAQIMGVEAGDVSVKGKTNERMGWIGSGEGLAVHAVALVERTGPGTPS